MKQMSRGMNLQKVTDIVTEFAKQNDLMESNQEVIGDALDAALDDNSGEQEEEIISAIMAEVAMEAKSKSALSTMPVTGAAATLAAKPAVAAGAVGGASSSSSSSSGAAPDGSAPPAGGDAGGAAAPPSALQMRLDALKKK